MNDMRKLIEAVQLDEYERTEPVYTEYRDPDGEFVVKYRASRGYYTDGPGADRAPSFDNLPDAIEHGELSVMSYGDAIEEDATEGEGRNNVSEITDKLRAAHEENVSNVLTNKFRGENVQLFTLGKQPGQRGMNWNRVEIKIDHVIYSEHDVNGPVYVSTDGKEYHQHPDHDVRVI